MSKYAGKLFSKFSLSLVVIAIAFANWRWPLYSWTNDTAVYRFIWLAIFFIILDFLIEIFMGVVNELRLIADLVGFSKNIHKLPSSFNVLTKVPLSNNLKADFIIVGSSGVWLIDLKDDGGKITFNGDDLVQKDEVLKGAITRVLEKSYVVSDLLKKNLNKDIKVAPVIAFSCSSVDMEAVPKTIRGVYVSSRKDIISLIENTDFQLIDNNSIDEVAKLIKDNKLSK